MEKFSLFQARTFQRRTFQRRTRLGSALRRILEVPVLDQGLWEFVADIWSPQELERRAFLERRVQKSRRARRSDGAIVVPNDSAAAA